MRIGTNKFEKEMNIRLNNSGMEEGILGVDIAHDGRMNEEVSHRIGEARKVSGATETMGE